jgi:hypothetical protein
MPDRGATVPNDDLPSPMKKMRRRDLFRAAAGAGIAASLGGAVATAAESPSLAARRDKRKPQYQPGSAEVQTFYRVNRYPASK